MKCIILAGGSGDRLWPLSRKNYPKQFMMINGTSIFQDTVTRNIPFCDEFFIITNGLYQPIVEGQMHQFQEIPYQIFLEEEGKGTAPAVCLMSLMISPEEDVLILPSDLIVQGEGYASSIYAAKDLAEKGQLVLFGVRPKEPSTSYGYIQFESSKAKHFIAHPSKEEAQNLISKDDTYWNGGMILAKNETLQNEMKAYVPDLVKRMRAVPDQGIRVSLNAFCFGKELFDGVPTGSIERLLLEKSKNVSVVSMNCDWKEVSDFKTYQDTITNNVGPSISEKCNNSEIINTDESRLVVANDLENVVVVNAKDAVYVTSKEDANTIKDIVQKYANDYDAYFNYGPISYRPWGTREIIYKDTGYRVRKIMIYPGASISRHSHEKRNENYTVVSGKLSVELGKRDGMTTRILAEGEGINVLPKVLHRIFNATDHPVIAIEVDTGAEIEERDMVYQDEESSELPSLYRLRPAFKDYLWGGNKLRDVYGKKTPYDITAESWELSAHPAGTSVICGGKYDGVSFMDFVAEHGTEVCGWKSKTFDRFPILIKFIDAKQSLSVQIHPADDYAFVNEGEFGKNEVWYVMDAQPGAYLYCGFREPTSLDEIKRRIADNTITDILNKVNVKTGDVIFIPAGTIHAIGAGIFICEIQQSSNCTYRVYDFDRVDKNGKPRELHVKKAMDVVDTTAYEKNAYGLEKPHQEGDAIMQTLCRCKYFESIKYAIDGEVVIRVDEASFRSIVVLLGSATISTKEESMDVLAGESVFVSAGHKQVHIKGECEIIVTNI